MPQQQRMSWAVHVKEGAAQSTTVRWHLPQDLGSCFHCEDLPLFGDGPDRKPAEKSQLLVISAPPAKTWQGAEIYLPSSYKTKFG